jgi:hypothetical protein
MTDSELAPGVVTARGVIGGLSKVGVAPDRDNRDTTEQRELQPGSSRGRVVLVRRR